MANVDVVDCRWFKITIKADAVLMDVVDQLLRMCSAVQIPYFFGSLNLKLTAKQAQELAQKIPGVDVQLNEFLDATAHSVSENEWTYEPWVYALALQKNQADETSDQDFCKVFLDLFKLDGRGALKVTKAEHKPIMQFAVRFAHKIKSASGLQPIVPRFVNDPSKNKVEVFKLFVSVYPAYCGICTRMGWRNKFYWSYNVDSE